MIKSLVFLIIIAIGAVNSADNHGSGHEHHRMMVGEVTASALTHGNHDDDHDDDHDDEKHGTMMDYNPTVEPSAIAQASKWEDHDDVIEAQDLSPCYGALTFGLLEKTKGRLEVVERQTVQFSVGLNKTSFNDTDCALVWVRIVVTPVTLEAATLVDSSTDALYSEVTNTRIIAVRKGARFPVRNYARGIFLGYSTLDFQALPASVNTTAPGFNISTSVSDEQWVTFRSGKVATFREHRIIDTIFQVVIFGLIICGNIGIGLDIHWHDIRDVIKRPIGPAIGFCCQYIVMPLSGFAVVKLIELPPNIALGIFLIACAPGGGGSNYHTYFLGGNLPLSVTMTFFSTIAAIGMMPLWVFTLGQLVLNESQSGIKVDFKGILGSLITSIVPFLIGIFIHWRRPELAKRLFRVVVRPLLFLIFAYMLTAGMVTNLYLFKLMRPKILLAGVCLPYLGFTCGLIIALLARQGLSIAVTIAIETGIQSAGVAFTTLFLSLPQPDADIAIVGPLAVTMFTPVPLWIAEILRGFYLCYKRKNCFIGNSKDQKKEGATEDEESLTEDVTSFSKEAPSRQVVEVKYKPSSLDVESSPKKSPVRDSGLQPLLSPVIESPSTEATNSVRASVVTEKSDASTLVPEKQEQTPPAQRQSSSSSSSSHQGKVRDSVYHDAES